MQHHYVLKTCTGESHNTHTVYDKGVTELTRQEHNMGRAECTFYNIPLGHSIGAGHKHSGHVVI